MSALTPLISDAQRELIVEALRLINANGERFPLSSDYDPHGMLKGSLLAIEGKHVLIAAMIGGHWDALTNSTKQPLPDPASVKADFDITQFWGWPADTKADGMIALAADLEVNALGRLAFQSLTEVAKAAKPPKRRDYSENYAQDDEQSASVIGSIMGTDLETDVTAETATTLPVPPKVTRKYRLTLDWSMWPTIGVLDAAVSDVQQAQYGVMIDVLFETMKASQLLSGDSVLVLILYRLAANLPREGLLQLPTNLARDFEPDDFDEEIGKGGDEEDVDGWPIKKKKP